MMNIIPETAGTTPNYWCTWATQNHMDNPILNSEDVSASTFEGDQGARYARNLMNEQVLLGKGGWVHDFGSVRKDMFLVLDDGWDVGYSNTPDIAIERFGSVILDEGKFLSYTGSPAERLKKLNNDIKQHGWRGIGLWISAQSVGPDLWPISKEEYDDTYDNVTPEMKQYWVDRIEWCRYAEVNYWKVDWGKHDHHAGFRKMLTELAASLHPELFVEHAYCSGPLNAYSMKTHKCETRFSQWDDIPERMTEFLKFSEILRTYDVTASLSIPTTLDRTAHLLSKEGGLLNCEDELYMAAALGCTFGVMRSPKWEYREGINYDPWNLKGCQDEITRALRWQRIAPAFSGGNIILSEQILSDSWEFESGDTWFQAVIGRNITQSAPAIVARNMELPKVVCTNNLPPYIVASKNSNSAVSIAALGRIKDKNTPVFPSAEVILNLECIPEYLGVFGNYDSISLVSKELISISNIYIQDLASENALDITNDVVLTEKSVLIPGDVLRSIIIKNDYSQPGVAIKFLA